MIIAPEIALLILESVLLVVTIILIVYSIREGKERDKLVEEMIKTTKVLTRQEYFNLVIYSLQKTKKEVIGYITGSFPGEMDKVEEIAGSIKKHK
jgi:hypothetical protein